MCAKYCRYIVKCSTPNTLSIVQFMNSFASLTIIRLCGRSRQVRLSYFSRPPTRRGTCPAQGLFFSWAALRFSDSPFRNCWSKNECETLMCAVQKRLLIKRDQKQVTQCISKSPDENLPNLPFSSKSCIPDSGVWILCFSYAQKRYSIFQR